jgi:hypothetical protein
MAAGAFVQSPKPAAPKLQQMVALGCVDKCTSAAQGLLDLIRCNLGTWFIPPTWYTVFGEGTVTPVLVISHAN